jgi:curved DNA-binding protein CbpA
MRYLGEVSNPYTVLGLDPSAGPAEIKRAYRRRARDCHPDRHGDTPELRAQFLRIGEAYKVLSNPLYKQFLDTFGRNPSEVGFDDQLVEDALQQERERSRPRRRTKRKVSRQECPDCEGTGIRSGGRNCQSCDPLIPPGGVPEPKEVGPGPIPEGRMRMPKKPLPRSRKPRPRSVFDETVEQKTDGDNKPRPSGRVRMRGEGDS